MIGARAVCALWLCFGIATCAASQPRPLRVAESAAPAFSVYTSRDGLGDEIWSTVGFDRDGFVWAGSASTIARFDGYRWTEVSLPGARSLVRDMQADEDGNLWVIFEREGLARYDGRRWEFVGEPRFYRRFASTPTAAGRDLWVAHAAGFARLHDGVWQEDPGNAAANLVDPITLSQTRALFGAPRQWMGKATEGLWFREVGQDGALPGPWQRFDHPLLNKMYLTDLLTSSEGGHEELWVTSYGGGVARIRADGVRIWRADLGELPSEATYSVVETRSGSGERLIWIASRAGLLRIRGDTVDVFDRRHGLPSDAVRGIKVQHDADGTDLLWVATEGGIARAAMTDSPWQTVSLIGASENGVFGLLLEPDDRGGERLWVGSAKEGLGLLQDGRWRMFTQRSGELANRSVRGIWRVPGPDGRPRRLLGLVGSGLMEIDDNLNIVPFAQPWPPHPEDGATQVLARTFDGAVEWWVGTLRSGVHRWREGTWTTFQARGAPASWTVLALAEQVDAEGRRWLWAAGPQGLARYDGEAWQMLEDVPGLPDDGFRSLTMFSERTPPELWIGSNRNAVVRLDVGDPRRPRLIDDGMLPPAPDPTVYSVLRDSRGRIYACTNNGVQQLTPRPDGSLAERVFRRRDGLVHDECNTGSQLIDGNDRYWVGTLGGLSVFDPDAKIDTAQPRPKPLHFTSLRADRAVHTLPGDEALDLPAGLRELQVDYALLSGQREGETRYRSQLLGYDRSATEWTPEHSRAFTGLPPGRYELRVEARDYTGTTSAPRILQFSIAPHWWQRASLQALAAGLFLLALVAAVLNYNRGLRARQRQLRGEVAARTAQLRAANERLTELSYLDPLTGVANRRRLIEAIDTAIVRAGAQRLPVGLIVVDVDHFKGYNDRHGHLAGDTALRAVAHALQSATRGQDLVARFGGEEFACLMIDADLAAVARIAERMRALVEALPPRSLGNDHQTITLSAGILSRVPAPGERAEDLLRVADGALYEAKKAGRNRVVPALG